MPKLGRRRLIQVSLEESFGVAVAGATNVLCYDPECNPTDAAIQRTPSGSFGGQTKAARGPAVGTAKLKAELRSNGASTLDVGLLALLQGCGYKLTNGVLAPVTLPANQKTVTIDFYSDGRKKRLYGAMGTAKLAGEFGKQVFVDFDFTGLYANLGDAALPSVTQTAYMPMLAKACVLTLGNYTPSISKFSIDPNMKPEPVEDVTASEAIGYYIIGPDRRFVVGMDPLIVPAATWDPEALWLAGTEAALSLRLSDGTVNVTIAAPKLQHMAPQEGMRESKGVHEITGQCNANLGDDELTITAAAA